MADNHQTEENGVSNGDYGASNGHAEPPAMSPTPLNSVPFTTTPSVPDVTPPPAKRHKSNGTAKMPEDKPFPERKKKRDGPALVFYPYRLAERDTKKVLSAAKGGVVLTGSAALAKVGPLLGSLDIGDTEDEYFFRVSLPGVSSDPSTFSCVVEPSGKVEVKGVTANTGERVVQKYSEVFELQTQNLCPAGEFSIAFTLPGPVDNESFSESFLHGLLVGKIKKRVSQV